MSAFAPLVGAKRTSISVQAPSSQGRILNPKKSRKARSAVAQRWPRSTPAGSSPREKVEGVRRWYIRAVAGPSHASYSIIDLMDAAAKGRPFSFRKPWVASSAEIARRDMRPLFGFCRCSRFARATSFGSRSLYFPASSPATSAYSKSGRFVGRDAVVPNSPMISMPVGG